LPRRGPGLAGGPQLKVQPPLEPRVASDQKGCKHPDAFACALLNSLPMAFYVPAQIVRDLKEHGGEIRAVDINHIGWDCIAELLF
jgi:hypothetical protein